MLLALPVVIIDWLITFVLKKTPVYFSISWSQAGLFMDLNHPCLETFFCPFLCFCEHPFLQLVVPHSCVPDLSLSLPSHPPASPAGESLCADWWNFFFPSRNTGSIKMTLAVLPAGPASPYCHAEDPGLAHGFLWAKCFGESSGRVSSSSC